VTRNMPAGLLVVNATGIISFESGANRCWEFADWDSALQRGLGASSEMTKLIGSAFRPGDFPARSGGACPARRRHSAPGSDDLADRRGEGKISGAICLLTDLTELAALQQRMQLIFPSPRGSARSSLQAPSVSCGRDSSHFAPENSPGEGTPQSAWSSPTMLQGPRCSAGIPVREFPAPCSAAEFEWR